MKKITEKTSKRICDHMNKDHLDSVHKYLKYYGNVNDFNVAEMEEINSKFIKIKYDNKFSKIYFEKEITEDEIHNTLVSMIKKIS